jgi:ribosomal protein S18 acetylase RimI-like enzyme
MDFTLKPLAEIDHAALGQLTRLHCAEMHGLLTDLGDAMVMRYYASAQSADSVLGLCAMSQDGGMVGWVIGSPNPAALNGHLRQSPGWFAGQMTRLVFTRPGVFLELMRSVFSASPANKLLPNQVELTYIGVAAHTRGKGLGRTLITAFVAQARLAGYQSVALSVETDNLSALALYKNSGFQIKLTFTEGRFSRHRMEYSLT